MFPYTIEWMRATCGSTSLMPPNERRIGRISRNASPIYGNVNTGDANTDDADNIRPFGCSRPAPHEQIVAG
jgi:hypothetical protein